eukprot:TRINITY_DN7030_c0_g1_i1.p1 TRINITY_DN7030_c0_g1~~TRINITY_DN7030_c0_g1_i1.p1  ORF type:complete len:963 (-),score=398.81 TRINITY_DN7030_c0_g1_i1:530-3418(-)
MSGAQQAKRKQVVIEYEDETPAQPSKSEPPVVPFADVAVLPEEGDNCAIARAVIPSGTLLRVVPGSKPFRINHTILEGHRFAITDVAPGERVLSWGLPFGVATRHIAPGNYLANEKVLVTLRARHVTDLPAEPNFDDLILSAELDEANFVPAPQVPLAAEHATATFQGFSRPEGRGVGTRNYIVVIGSTSVSAGFVKELEARVKSSGLAGGFPNVDGVVAVAHTEGGGTERPHNFDLLCRTLTAFMVHPNVAAAVVVDYGSEAVTNDDLRAFAAQHSVPLDKVLHRFVRLSGDYEADLQLGEQIVREFLPEADKFERTAQPLSTLNIAQQCGGSDAFSGVSGNPCAGHACGLLIQHGGQAVLAETDELMGAEAYILRRVKDLPTAKKFVSIIERFKERLAWHGQTAEANPSGGNNWRGLYNIALKSLGAAKKKHADVRLDGVLEYGEQCHSYGRGYYMMDSPGNDLESIAGQVASGCNLIYFITGNGSITNFPFVPTIKIVTTTARYNLLSKDMDFNAGRYQEGTPMATLGEELFQLTLQAASGQLTVGERAGHAQVSIWRNWPQAGPTDVTKYNYGALHGDSLVIKSAPSAANSGPVLFDGFSTPAGVAIERVGLILPTSLCSGEVARKICGQLNAQINQQAGDLHRHVSRFVCLPHTEGCGTGYPDGGIELYTRVLVGHLTHPSVRMALCLEHGCEKTHNDFMNNALTDLRIDPAQFGYASIQLDGGIEKVTAKVSDYFAQRAAVEPVDVRQPIDLRQLVVGLMVCDKSVPAEAALLCAALVRRFAEAGGTVVVPQNSPLLKSAAFVDDLVAAGGVKPTIAFGQSVRSSKGVHSGCHIMDMPLVDDWAETVTGLAAAGVHTVLAVTTPPTRGVHRPTPGHPIVPVAQVAVQASPVSNAGWAASADLVLTKPDTSVGESYVDGWLDQTLQLLANVAAGRQAVKSSSNVFFQITRGPTGVST